MATSPSDICNTLPVTLPLVSFPPAEKRLRPSSVVKPAKTAEPKTEETQTGRFARLLPHGINWGVMGWIALLHAGALAMPFFFSWTGLVMAIALHWLTGGIGICLGYHRLFTHSSFKTVAPLRWLIAGIGGLAGEGPVIEWVANHRKHHALSDKDGDPHSPHDGPWWSHMFWFARLHTKEEYETHIKRWAPDLQKDPMLRAVGLMFLPSQFILGITLFALGWWVGGWYLACSWLAWGLFGRVIFVLHSTWFVNSAAHLWGYVNYKTTDDSRNNWWVALITYGEGWHNNHHAYPRMANHGHRWWEFDVTFRTIRFLSRLGLAWDVVDYKHRNEVADR